MHLFTFRRSNSSSSSVASSDSSSTSSTSSTSSASAGRNISPRLTPSLPTVDPQYLLTPQQRDQLWQAQVASFQQRQANATRDRRWRQQHHARFLERSQYQELAARALRETLKQKEQPWLQHLVDQQRQQFAQWERLSGQVATERNLALTQAKSDRTAVAATTAASLANDHPMPLSPPDFQPLPPPPLPPEGMTDKLLRGDQVLAIEARITLAAARMRRRRSTVREGLQELRLLARRERCDLMQDWHQWHRRRLVRQIIDLQAEQGALVHALQRLVPASVENKGQHQQQQQPSPPPPPPPQEEEHQEQPQKVSRQRERWSLKRIFRSSLPLEPPCPAFDGNHQQTVAPATTSTLQPNGAMLPTPKSKHTTTTNTTPKPKIKTKTASKLYKARLPKILAWAKAFISSSRPSFNFTHPLPLPRTASGGDHRHRRHYRRHVAASPPSPPPPPKPHNPVLQVPHLELGTPSPTSEGQPSWLCLETVTETQSSKKTTMCAERTEDQKASKSKLRKGPTARRHGGRGRGRRGGSGGGEGGGGGGGGGLATARPTTHQSHPCIIALHGPPVSSWTAHSNGNSNSNSSGSSNSTSSHRSRGISSSHPNDPNNTKMRQLLELRLTKAADAEIQTWQALHAAMTQTHDHALAQLLMRSSTTCTPSSSSSSSSLGPVPSLSPTRTTTISLPPSPPPTTAAAIAARTDYAIDAVLANILKKRQRKVKAWQAKLSAQDRQAAETQARMAIFREAMQQRVVERVDEEMYSEGHHHHHHHHHHRHEGVDQENRQEEEGERGERSTLQGKSRWTKRTKKPKQKQRQQQRERQQRLLERHRLKAQQRQLDKTREQTTDKARRDE
ncbi:hypothetical protein BGZ73_007030 [Actinomortierella ambigua]|nr:hypothetical protein BGZ73_007030 [Actinomortierella ambigua]